VKWALIEEEMTRNPLLGTVSPQVPEQPVPVLTVEQLRALFKACEDKDFATRRDMAIVRLFLDTGVRLAELARLSTEDVDLDNRKALVLGKAGEVGWWSTGTRPSWPWTATSASA
jgi:site-specific recombinase XerC